MIDWKHPEWLFAWTLLLVVGIQYVWFRRRQSRYWKTVGEADLLTRMGFVLTTKHSLRHLVLSGMAMALLIMALANPRIGRRYERVQQMGVDIIIALDISNSMLASDEQPTRLARAKLLINQFLDQAKGDRVGLVVFAGDAFVLVPMTGDYQALKSMLAPVSPELIARQGTAIGKAIEIGIQTCSSSSEPFGTILILTDGEDHEGGALEMAARAREQGLRVHTIGIGSSSGTTIMEPVAGNNSRVKRDRSGQEVLTRMNPEILAGIAQQGGGEFKPLADISGTLDHIYRLLDQMTEQEFDERLITDYKEQFSWPLALAFILLVLASVGSFRKQRDV